MKLEIRPSPADDAAPGGHCRKQGRSMGCREMNPYDATASFSWSGANVGVNLAAGYLGVYGRAISYY